MAVSVLCVGLWFEVLKKRCWLTGEADEKWIELQSQYHTAAKTPKLEPLREDEPLDEERVNNISNRFGNQIARSRIEAALRDCGGHAGRATAKLIEILAEMPAKDADAGLSTTITESERSPSPSYEIDEERLSNLMNRFPLLSEDEVSRVLIRHKGHAGKAAVELTELARQHDHDEEDKRARDGQSWDELEQRWKGALDEQPVTDDEEEAAPAETWDELEERLLQQKAIVEETTVGLDESMMSKPVGTNEERLGSSVGHVSAMATDQQYSSDEIKSYKTTSSVEQHTVSSEDHRSSQDQKGTSESDGVFTEGESIVQARFKWDDLELRLRNKLVCSS